MVIKPNKLMMEYSKSFEYKWKDINPMKISLVYQYLVSGGGIKQSMFDMACYLNFSTATISHSLRILEEYGFIIIDKSDQPYSYQVIK